MSKSLLAFGAVAMPGFTLAGFANSMTANHQAMDQFHSLFRRSADLYCGNTKNNHNPQLFQGLPDRVVIAPAAPNEVDPIKTMSDFEYEQYRIVNGQEARPGSWPWQIRARPCSKWRCTYLCGGSLLSKTWSITAAHCIPYAADQGTITVGAHNLWNSGTNYTIKSIVPHPGWNRYKRNNDVALLHHKSVAFTDSVQPICLPSPDVCFNEGTACVVSGWGYTTERGPISDTLQEVAVKIIDYKTCSDSTMYSTMVFPDTQVCAGYVDGQKDSCAGDSGGPLACRLGPNDPWVLYGVVSWGWGCARARKPGVYAKASHFHDWIQETTGGFGQVTLPEKASGTNYGCATCEPHLDGSCGESIGQVPAEPVTTTQAPTTTTEEITTPLPITTKPVVLTTTTTEAPATVEAGDWAPCDIVEGSSAIKGQLTSANFPQWYSPKTQCRRKLFENKDDTKYMIVTVQQSMLDKRNCARSGDKLEIKCDNKYYNFCDRSTAKSSHGQLMCRKVVEVFFRSDSDKSNKGFQLSYEAVTDMKVEYNACGVPSEIFYDGSSTTSYGIVNLYRSALYQARNKECDWMIKTPKGTKAVVMFSKVKNFITAAWEKKDPVTKKWSQQCRDAIFISNGSGNNMQTICGKNSFRSGVTYVSNQNSIKIKLDLDSSVHRRERLFFWVGYKDATGKIRSL